MINELLSKLSALDIRVSLKNESELNIDAPKGSMTPDLVNELRQQKADLIKYLLRHKGTKDLSIPKAEQKDYYNLSPAQRRMFFLNEISENNISYNMVTSVELPEDFDPKTLEDAIKEVIIRHESLRTSFRKVNGTTMQYIHEEVDFKIEVVEVPDKSYDQVATTLIEPFDLEVPPLMRAFLVSHSEGKTLMVYVHHIITDGISLNLITKDLQLIMNGTKLGPLPIQYKDYAEYVTSPEFEEKLATMQAFWKKELADLSAPVDLPQDTARPAVKRDEGRSVKFFLTKEQRTGIKELAEKNNVTIFMTILSVFQVFVSRLSGRNDTVVGVPMSGRFDIQLNQIVGMFVNTLPYRASADLDKHFSEFLQENKATSLSVFENQQYQFDEIVNDMSLQRDASRNPLFDIVFDYSNRPDSSGAALSTEAVEQFTHDMGYGQFDITFKVSDMGDLLYIDFDYNSILYTPERVERFAQYFKALVTDIIDRPDQLIGEYIAPDSKEQHVTDGRNYWDHQLRETETIAFPGKQTNKSALGSPALQNEVTVSTTADASEAKAIAVLKTLLYRYTGQTDLAIHYLEDRQEADQTHQPLLLRTGLSGEHNSAHIQDSITAELTNVIRYADSYRQQLCDQHQYQQAQRNANVLFCQTADFKEQTFDSSVYDLVVRYQQTTEGLSLAFTSAENVFDSREFDRFCDYYRLIWNLVNEAIDQPVDALAFLPQEEQTELLEVLSGEKTAYPSDKTLHALFSEQAALYPDELAVIDSTTSITYKELDERSGRLANYLLSNELVERDKPVGVMMDKSAEMLVTFLGILKAGAGYMPLDPENPASRIAAIVETASPVLIITKMDYMMQVQEFYMGNLVMPDVQEAEINACPAEVSITDESASQLAYVMFTSGSTGEPKGVVIEHRGVVRLVRDTNYVDFKPGERMLSTSSFSFDGSTFEIWGMLLNGGHLIIYPKEQFLNIKFLEEKIVAHEIRLMWMTTSLFNELSENSEVIFQQLNYVLTGGDKMSVKHINKMRQQNSELTILNVYGPTENTTYSTFHVIEDYYHSDVPLGRPIANTEIYILDQQQRLVPQGVVGELYMGGDGLARGYLQKSEVNDAKFIEHPYKKGERLYNTGDQGRWNADGLLEFFGRNDHQVKIRGFRVELGEIETVMMRFPQIKRAKVVVKQQEQNEKYILAYYTNDGEPAMPERIKDYLIENLPDYMVPAHLIPVESFPMNINGKIDVKKLPLPEVELHHYEAPTNEVETRLIALWSDVLKLDPEKIGIAADFFEIGGHSLRAATLVNAISDEFGVTMQLIKVFEKTTVKEQAAFISIEKTLNESAMNVEEDVTEVVI